MYVLNNTLIYFSKYLFNITSSISNINLFPSYISLFNPSYRPPPLMMMMMIVDPRSTRRPTVWSRRRMVRHSKTHHLPQIVSVKTLKKQRTRTL